MADWPEVAEVVKRLRRVRTANAIPSDARGKGLFRSYVGSYPAYLRYFQDRSPITPDDLIIGAGLVYGWMPRALTIEPALLEESTLLLDQARRRMLKPAELTQLAKAMGNSLVGASKLLHFVAPAKYPIWDSRVCRFLLGTAYQGLLQDPEIYLRYAGLCQSIVAAPDFPALAKVAESMCQYPVDPFRAVELLMFVAGAKV
ncbi:MAG: hypothetical protein SGJ01_05465 [Gemmatimonadota bacterium]|nr:hypothetical protein [Gemmatimonadota bacterium]